MYYKYKKYKKKYIDFKNQIGGECTISPDNDTCNEPLTTQDYTEYKLVDSLTNLDTSLFTCYSSIAASELLFTSTNKDNGFPNESILDSISEIC